MEYTIKSRKIGKEITFSMLDEGGYIWCDYGDPKNYGSLGSQICLSDGNTISYNNASLDKFQRICRNYWRRYISTNY